MNIHSLPIGEDAPEKFNVVVEIIKGSHNKYEYDEKLGVFMLDRVLYSPMHYPLDYGFIPETRSEDGDHLDAMIIGGDPVFPGCVVAVRPVGLFKMIDGGEEDFKILAVQARNPRFSHIQNLEDVDAYNNHLTKEIAHFFSSYKHLEGKEVQVIGWEDVDKAKGEIVRAMEMFKAGK